MKRIIFFLLIILGISISCLSQTNLALTAAVSASSTNASYPVSNVNDNNTSTNWQSSGCASQTLTFTLTKTVRFSTITVTNIKAIDGFSIQISADNSTWTTIGTYASATPVTVTKTNIYMATSTQFVPYSYIRLSMGANQGVASVYEVSITEDPTLFASFTGCSYYSGGPINALDGNTSTDFINYNTQFYLSVNLSKTVYAMNVNVNSDIRGLRVDITDVNGIVTSGYYYTLQENDNFLVVNPTGIQAVMVASDKADAIVYLYELQLQELNIGGVSLNYTYDLAGNMASREILYITSNSGIVQPNDTIIQLPYNDSIKNKPITDEIAGKKVTVFPNPTTGQVIATISNIVTTDQVKIEVFSVSGVKVFESPVNAESNTINLGNRPNGTYFMLFTVNGNVQKWTIIKQ